MPYMPILRTFALQGLRAEVADHGANPEGVRNHLAESTAASASVSVLLQSLLRSKDVLGCQAAAFYRGKLVLHLSAGLRGDADSGPVEADTLFPSFSVTKGVIVTLLHRLVEKGMLRYEDSVHQHWPSFCTSDPSQAMEWKRGITVRHLLSHTSGLQHAISLDVNLSRFCDFNRMVAAMETALPLHAPGDPSLTGKVAATTFHARRD